MTIKDIINSSTLVCANTYEYISEGPGKEEDIFCPQCNKTGVDIITKKNMMQFTTNNRKITKG